MENEGEPAMIEMDIRKAFTFIEPGPVTLVTSSDGKHDSLMTISWIMAVDNEPRCLLALSSGSWNHTFDVMLETGECAVCVPPADMAEDVVRMGVESSTETDKFALHGLTKFRGTEVAAPLIEECIACLECKVVDYIKQYGIVVLRCHKLWCNAEKEFAPMLHANGDGTFRADDPQVFNYREIMRKWVPAGSERFA